MAGPLLGGLITDNLSWRWIFYINIPIGIVALVVISSVLRMPFTRSRHDIDYLGTVLMTLGVSSALLVTVWGGTQYAWGSPLIIGLAASAVVLVALFALWERHAAEPILPPHLFRSGIFRVASSASFLLSMVLFGALIYMPVYLQLVDGVSAMVSGLLVIPMMAGVLVASVGSGQIVTRTGRYKIFPVVGAVLMGLGMWLLSHLGLHTSHVTMSLYLVVLGAGFGMIMQIMVLATQNAVEPTELGTATSAVMFFRSLGGAFGTSLFGAIFVAGLGHWLPRLLPASVSGSIHLQGNFSMTPAQLHAYPVAIQNGILESFVRSLHTVFLVGVPLAVLTFGITLLLKEQPLRTSSRSRAGQRGRRHGRWHGRFGRRRDRRGRARRGRRRRDGCRRRPPTGCRCADPLTPGAGRARRCGPSYDVGQVKVRLGCWAVIGWARHPLRSSDRACSKLVWPGSTAREVSR